MALERELMGAMRAWMLQAGVAMREEYSERRKKLPARSKDHFRLITYPPYGRSRADLWLL